MSIQNSGLAGISETSWPIEWARSQDLREGIKSFLEKRDAKFKGQ